MLLQELKQHQIVGNIISPNRRNQIAKEFKNTHFVLGGQSSNTARSCSQQQFVSHKVAKSDFNIRQTDTKMKQTNFMMGNGNQKTNQDQMTTNRINFAQPPEGYKTVTIDAATKAELRKSHWGLGGQSKIFTSTQIESYQKRDGSVSSQDRQQLQSQIGLMRGHHFKIGNQAPIYQTTSQSRHQDFSDRFKEARPQKVTASNELRKHHFEFGGTNGSMKTTSQIQFGSKQVESPSRLIGVKPEFHKTCISFGGAQKPLFHQAGGSLSSQFEQNSGSPSCAMEKQDLNLKKNLRASHFQLGQHPTMYDSANKEYGMTKQQSTSKSTINQTEMKRKWLDNQVQLGDQKLANAYFSTTYQIFNVAPPQQLHSNKEKGITNTRSFSSSIVIGGTGNAGSKNDNKLQTTTSTGSTYVIKNMKQALPNCDFKEALKSNHFNLAHGSQKDPNHFTSTMVNFYKETGKDSRNDCRGMLNQQQKADLRANHFQYGSPNGGRKMYTMTQAFYQLPTINKNQTASKYASSNAQNLKYESFKMQNPSTTSRAANEHVTSNMIAYKWVQPQYQKE